MKDDVMAKGLDRLKQEIDQWLVDRIHRQIDEAYQRGYDAGLAARRTDRLFEIEDALRGHACASSGPIRSVGHCIDTGRCGCYLHRILQEREPEGLRTV